MGADAPGQVPAAVAAEVQATVAVEVPTDDPEIEGEPGLATPEPGSDLCAVEPISGPAPAEPVVEMGAVEPISGPTPAEPVVEKCAVEPISGPAPAEPVVEKCAVEPISGPAPAESGSDLCAVEPISEPTTKMPDFERFGPYAGYLRNVKLMLDTTYGDEGSIDAPAAEPAFAEGPPSGPSSRPNPGDVAQPGGPSDGAPRDTPLSRATEQWRLRNIELSRQIDERFGINGDRPDPGRPPPVSDG